MIFSFLTRLFRHIVLNHMQNFYLKILIRVLNNATTNSEFIMKVAF